MQTAMLQQPSNSTPHTDKLSALAFIRRLFDIALLAFLLLFFEKALLGCRSFHESHATHVAKDLAAIQQSVSLYEIAYGQPPTSLEQLVEVHIFRKYPTDPWGTPYEAFVRHDGTGLAVRSAGPDRELGTLDDVYQAE